MEIQNHLMDALSVIIHAMLNVISVNMVNVISVGVKVGLLMLWIIDVYHFVEIQLLLDMNNVMMGIMIDMMDVMNVILNVKKNVLYVQKIYVINVILLDGLYLIINAFLFVEIIQLLEQNNAMMVMTFHMMVVLSVKINVKNNVHYVKMEYAMNVIHLDGY